LANILGTFLIGLHECLDFIHKEISIRVELPGTAEIHEGESHIKTPGIHFCPVKVEKSCYCPARKLEIAGMVIAVDGKMRQIVINTSLGNISWIGQYGTEKIRFSQKKTIKG